jgi:hypothetical protein
VKRVIRNLVAFYEMEAQAAGVLLSHAQEALKASDCRVGSQVPENHGPVGEELTWQEKVDREIARTEMHLQQRLDECDRILEVLTVGRGATPSTWHG